jgi:hypothetical protein
VSTHRRVTPSAHDEQSVTVTGPVYSAGPSTGCPSRRGSAVRVTDSALALEVLDRARTTVRRAGLDVDADLAAVSRHITAIDVRLLELERELAECRAQRTH